MENEFAKKMPNTVSSVKGFEVEVGFANGVTYRKGTVEIFFDSEWILNPPGIVLYLKSPSNRGIAGLDPNALKEIVDDVTRALQWRGHEVEIE